MKRLLLAGLCAGGALLAGCDGSNAGEVRVPVPDGDPGTPRTRYEFANQCVALRAKANDKYVAAVGDGYAATATLVPGAAAFYLKPSALGSYLLYHTSGQLLSANCASAGAVCNESLDAATDESIFVVKKSGDATAYPSPPQFDVEPTPAEIAAYRGFVEPAGAAGTRFTFAQADGSRLNAGADGALTIAAAAAGAAQEFTLEPLSTASCAAFPEASNNASGTTFRGTTADNRVLGMADTHVHIVSTTFLGGAKWGAPFHKFGVTHALAACTPAHGEMGERDFVGAAYQEDTNGHNTTGWPFNKDDPDGWPARESLTHESIYWKWLERAWLAGLRVVVNDLVENQTLCELQRNADGGSAENCNEMVNARNQVGTLYAMQDYIDAQYGGRGKGWFRIVLTPQEARSVVAAGKLAVIIGIEISNLFDCQLTYRPTRQKEPFEEDGAVGENAYQCAMTETGAANEIKTQLDHVHDLGVRQVISIHEFDNGFGGNGIFNALFLNLGNRENTGGNPTPGVPPDDPFALNPPNETPSGEFWTTYNCETADELKARTGVATNGYIWNEGPGAVLENLGPPPPLCAFTGQGGRQGGTTACYPAARQCNARWMTPLGLYVFKKLMEKGMIIDFDHLTIDMKDQLLDLTEKQSPAYPLVSTHGTYGGTTREQARRVLDNGGNLYPALDNTPKFLDLLTETRAIWADAATPYLFGFGFGTDTNGMSGQAGPRSAERITQDGPVVYPYTLFRGEVFDAIADFAAMDDDGDPATPWAGVTFLQPEERDAAGNGRTWHADIDGTAHQGMLSDNVQEIRLDAKKAARTQPLRDLFNSAEVQIQTWSRTLAAQQAILANDNGGQAKGTPAEILRAAPVDND